MENISKFVKFRRVFKKKFSKPIAKAILISFALYIVIANLVFKHDASDVKPHFVISSISNKFDVIEYTHLLLSIQEICKNKSDKKELIEYVNGPYPNTCSDNLKEELYEMNWDQLAFLSRVKKLFELSDRYDRLNELEETAVFLENEVVTHRLPKEAVNYIELLRNEKQEIINNHMNNGELSFIKEYYAFINKLRIR